LPVIWARLPKIFHGSMIAKCEGCFVSFWNKMNSGFFGVSRPIGSQKTSFQPRHFRKLFFQLLLVPACGGSNISRSMARPQNNAYTILIADDSDDDRFFLRKAIERFPRFKIIGEVTDGQEAISYLSGQADFADRRKYPLPDLLLLDLKMPRKNGFEVLQWLRTQSFPALLVVVLSGSSLPTDVEASLALGARGYWTKTAQPPRQNIIAKEIEALLDKGRQRI